MVMDASCLEWLDFERHAPVIVVVESIEGLSVPTRCVLDCPLCQGRAYFLLYSSGVAIEANIIFRNFPFKISLKLVEIYVDLSAVLKALLG